MIRNLTGLLFSQLFMATGEPGADGPRVQRPAEAASSQGAEHALIQPLGMAAVPVQDPLLNRNRVTPHHAKVMWLAVVFVCRCCCFVPTLCLSMIVVYVSKRSSNNYLPFFQFYVLQEIKKW